MTKTVKPFFARYLETSENADLRAQTEVKAGADGGGTTWPPKQTLKYPSDGDDCYQSNEWDLDYR